MWTSLANQAYMSVTAHFINAEFQLESVLLDTREFLEAHTASNIATELEAVLDEWDLSSLNIGAVVTDNGSNIVRAVNDLGWMNFNCFSHTLQLAVIEGTSTPEISKSLGRCRRLAGHFHHSPKSTDLLKQKQLDLHVSQHSELFELRRGDLMPTDHEFAAMERHT